MDAQLICAAENEFSYESTTPEKHDSDMRNFDIQTWSFLLRIRGKDISSREYVSSLYPVIFNF